MFMSNALPVRFTQTFYEASDGAGNVKCFYVNIAPQDAEAQREALAYADGCGYVVKFGRHRLNDYVGSPVWSNPVLIEEL